MPHLKSAKTEKRVGRDRNDNKSKTKKASLSDTPCKSGYLARYEPGNTF